MFIESHWYKASSDPIGKKKVLNFFIIGEKINLLYTKLAKKNAEIYIQRSQQLYLKGLMRTSLCVWTLEDVDIIAIADTSYHGTERVVSRIKSLDPER